MSWKPSDRIANASAPAARPRRSRRGSVPIRQPASARPRIATPGKSVISATKPSPSRTGAVAALQTRLERDAARNSYGGPENAATSVDRAVRLGVVVQHAHVRAREQARDEREAEHPGDAGDDDRPRRAGAPAPPPHDRCGERPGGEQVQEHEPEREAERELPRGDEPAGEDRPRRAAPVAAQQQEQRERDPAAGDHVHVALLLQPPGRVREREAGDRRAGAADPELAREQPRAGEAQRVGEEKQRVVARDRGVRARADQAGRGVADERVGEREAVVQRPERVRLEEPRRLVGERMPVPRDLPGLHERVAEVLRDVAAHVQRQRPVHREREREPQQRDAEQLPPGQRRARYHAGSCAPAPAGESGRVTVSAGGTGRRIRARVYGGSGRTMQSWWRSG